MAGNFARIILGLVGTYVRWKGLIFGLAGAICILPLPDVRSEPLEAAVERALDRSPELSAGALLLLEADEGVNKARSVWKPDVSLKIRGGRKRTTTDTTTSVANTTSFNPVSATLSVSQHLVDFGGASAVIRKSAILKKISSEQFRKTKQEIIIGAVSAYITVWRDLKLLTVSASNEKVLNEQYVATQKRSKMREVTRTDLSQARARLQDAVSSRISADLTLQESLANFEERIGPMFRLNDIAWSLDLLGRYQLPSTIQLARDLAYKNNSDMRQVRLEHKLARYSVLEKKSALLPTISLEASLSDSRNSAATIDQSRDLSLDGVLTVPLYDSGASWSDLNRAKIGIRIVLENEKSTRLNLDRKILSLWNTLQRTDGQILSIEASVAANEMALQGVRREVEVGTRTTLDLLNAENEYVQAQASLISAVHNKSQSHFALMFECGLLDEVFVH